MSGKADLKEAARILLLEDEEDLGRLYVKSLEKEGYQVLWLRSTRSAA